MLKGDAGVRSRAVLADDLAAVQRLRISHPSLTIVRFVVGRLDRDVHSAGELLVDDDAPFAEVWNAARRSRRRSTWVGVR